MSCVKATPAAHNPEVERSVEGKHLSTVGNALSRSLAET